jgi:hypothetical protein
MTPVALDCWVDTQVQIQVGERVGDNLDPVNKVDRGMGSDEPWLRCMCIKKEKRNEYE